MGRGAPGANFPPAKNSHVAGKENDYEHALGVLRLSLDVGQTRHPEQGLGASEIIVGAPDGSDHCPGAAISPEWGFTKFQPLSPRRVT
jgi:hypothetical protein